MLTKSDILLLAMVVTESLTLCGKVYSRASATPYRDSKVYRRAACTSLWEAASCLASCTLIVAFCLHTASYDDAVREVGAIGEPSCGLHALRMQTKLLSPRSNDDDNTRTRV